MRIGSFLFVRDEAEEAYLRAQGWKLKDTDRAYMVRHNMLTFGARWKVCRSKLDVAVYFLRAFAYYIKANIQRLLESGQGPRPQGESRSRQKMNDNAGTGGCTL